MNVVYENVLIGSHAINIHNPNILQRTAKDIDYLSIPRKKRKGNIEYIDGSGLLDKYSFSDKIASLDEIYTLKVSHSEWEINGSRNWGKHIRDIHLLKQHDAKLVPELYKIAYKEWENRHGKKRINLNQDKEDFFTSGIKRKYVHDSIHASVAFNENPMFMKILADNSEVQTSKQKFEQLSHQEKTQLCSEEIFVLSLERELIPLEDSGKQINHIDIQKAYDKHLRLLITKLSKGYFPLWMIENFVEIRKPIANFWDIFQKSDKKELVK